MASTDRTMEIARIIIEQIKSGDRSALMAWGANSFCAISECKEHEGGVSFKVNGLHFKGWVQICLTWSDLYTITFINRKSNVSKKVEEVYCDMLVPVIDWIEGR
jgi:hypothetical protein